MFIEEEEFDENTSNSLNVEIGLVDGFHELLRLDRDTCGKRFLNQETLKKHKREEGEIASIKNKEAELKKSILEQRYNISSSLINLNRK